MDRSGRGIQTYNNHIKQYMGHNKSLKVIQAILLVVWSVLGKLRPQPRCDTTTVEQQHVPPMGATRSTNPAAALFGPVKTLIEAHW
jgi:hypothetical protein